MTPSLPLFSPMMPYGTGLTPQPVQNTNSLSLLEEQQRQQQQQAASQQQGGMVGGSGQTPQLYHSQISTTTALPGNTPNYTTTPLTPMTPSRLPHRPRRALASSLSCSEFFSCHYIYAFSRHFYPKRLSEIRLYFFYFIFISMCSVRIEPTTFCPANAMLCHHLAILSKTLLIDFRIIQMILSC